MNYLNVGAVYHSFQTEILNPYMVCSGTVSCYPSRSVLHKRSLIEQLNLLKKSAISLKDTEHSAPCLVNMKRLTNLTLLVDHALIKIILL